MSGLWWVSPQQSWQGQVSQWCTTNHKKRKVQLGHSLLEDSSAAFTFARHLQGCVDIHANGLWRSEASKAGECMGLGLSDQRVVLHGSVGGRTRVKARWRWRWIEREREREMETEAEMQSRIARADINKRSVCVLDADGQEGTRSASACRKYIQRYLTKIK